MKRFSFVFLIFLMLFSGVSFAEGAKTVWVDGYTRSNGTYVSGHYRSPPASSGISYDNYSSYSQNNIIVYYEYEIQIWKNGIEFRGRGYDAFPSSNNSSSSHCGSSYYDNTAREASENAVTPCSESLYNYAYSLGLNHNEVAEFITNTFTEESCVSHGSKKRTEPGKVFHKEIMRCIIE
jgi:hypothetical protein